MDPRHFLALADGLVKQKGPAEFRSAVGRAYYAVYNVGWQFLARMGIPKAKAESHVHLQRRLLNSGDMDFIQIACDLGDLHRRRNLADYDMNDKTIEGEQPAQSSVRVANRMIAAFDNCPINGTRWKQIQAAINRVAV